VAFTTFSPSVEYCFTPLACLKHTYNLYCVGADVKPCSINQSIKTHTCAWLISENISKFLTLSNRSCNCDVIYEKMSTPDTGSVKVR